MAIRKTIKSIIKSILGRNSSEQTPQSAYQPQRPTPKPQASQKSNGNAEGGNKPAKTKQNVASEPPSNSSKTQPDGPSSGSKVENASQKVIKEENVSSEPSPAPKEKAKSKAKVKAKTKAKTKTKAKPKAKVKTKEKAKTKAKAKAKAAPEAKAAPKKAKAAPKVEVKSEESSELTQAPAQDIAPSDKSIQKDNEMASKAVYTFTANGIIPETCPECHEKTHDNWLRDNQEFVCASCSEPYI